MFRLRYLILGILLVGLVADFSEARGRRRGRRSRVAYNNAQSHANGVAIGGNAQQVAEQKASLQARRGWMGHPGGSMGGGTYEGVGFSTYSAQAALNNCCNNGSTIIGQSAVRGANGWYACRIYR